MLWENTGVNTTDIKAIHIAYTNVSKNTIDRTEVGLVGAFSNIRRAFCWMYNQLIKARQEERYMSTQGKIVPAANGYTKPVYEF